jgi:hypothetical protein
MCFYGVSSRELFLWLLRDLCYSQEVWHWAVGKRAPRIWEHTARTKTENRQDSLGSVWIGRKELLWIHLITVEGNEGKAFYKAIDKSAPGSQCGVGVGRRFVPAECRILVV